MNNDYLKEKISYHKDMKNNYWTGFIVSLSGTLGLTFLPLSPYNIIMIIAGSFIATLSFYAYFNRLISIKNLLKKLKEGDKKYG